MKFKLNKPALSVIDITNINYLCHHMGWIFQFIPERRYIIETIDDIGYIQTDENNRVFIVWKSTENIDYLHDWINNILNMKKLLKLPRKLKLLNDILTKPIANVSIV